MPPFGPASLPMSGYEPVDAGDSEKDAFHTQSLDDVELITTQRKRLNLMSGILCLSMILNVLVMGGYFVGSLSKRTAAAPEMDWVPWKGTKPVWSPAADAIVHEHVLAKTFTQVSKYHGPRTTESDKAWAELYMPYAWSALSRKQIEPLMNHTSRVLGDIEYYGEPRYAVGLDVFHQLHCLDMIRKELKPAPPGSPPRIPPKFLPVSAPGEPPYDHIDHCLNAVRESLMCQPDITPGVWQWNPDIQQNRARIDVVHTCANFEKLQEWGLQNKLHLLLNVTTHVKDLWDTMRVLPTP